MFFYQQLKCVVCIQVVQTRQKASAFKAPSNLLSSSQAKEKARAHGGDG